MGNWKANAKGYFRQCYDNEFDQEHEFVKGHEFCQVIGCAIYGEQADAEIDENDATKFGYSKEKADHIIKIQNKMYDISPTVKIRVYKTMIWMYIDENKQGPTIAFKFKGKDGYVFIDASCRVYKTWDDFKENNKLPECQVAYPRGGVVQVDSDGDILVDFEDSPACSLGSQITNVTDTVAAVAGIGTTAVALAGLFFPLTAPISIGLMVAGGTTGVYGTVRSTTTLIDRSTHEESISLADSEARLHWLNIATAPLAIAGSAASAITSRMAASGQVLSKTAQVLVNTTIFGSFAMTSVNLANNLGNLVDKAMKNELTTLDVTSFVISTVFWTNSAMNLRTAQTIIKTTQREVINGYSKDLSNKQSRQFKSMVGNTRDDAVPRDPNNPLRRNMHDNAKVIRAIRQINDPKDFFQSAISTNKEIKAQNKKYGQETSSTKFNKLYLSLDDYPGLKHYSCMNINNQLKVHPEAFRQLSSDDRHTILKATINFVNNGDKNAFLNQVKAVRGIRFEVHRNDAINGFCHILKVSNLKDYKCNGKKLFDNLKPHEKNRLIQVENTLNTGSGSKSDPNLQQTQRDIAIKFAETMKPETFSDFMSYVEFAIAKQQNDMKNISGTNKPNHVPLRNFKVNEYCNQFKDATGNWKQSAFNAMKADFDAKRAVIKPLNDKLYAPFASPNAAVYHVEKHGDLGEFASKTYMDQINYVIDNATENNLSMSQEGNATFLSCILKEEGSNIRKQVFVIYNSENNKYTMSMFDK